MAPYSVEIVFTGLAFFCFPGADQEACPLDEQTTYVYLVNAQHEREVCKRTLPGNHEAVFAFDRRFLEYADESLYEIKPAPDGGQVVVAPLEGIVGKHEAFDVCFREECTHPPGCGDLQASPPGTADAWPGLSKKQKAPKFYKPDANHLDWLAYVPDVEERCSYDLRPEVACLNPDFVHGRIRLDRGGTLATGAHSRKRRKLFSRPYTLWESTRQQNRMPKAFAGAVTLTLRDLRGALLVQTGCEPGETPRTLFRLRGKPSRGKPSRALQLHVSNLPAREVDPVGRTAQDHFLWYYYLYDEYEYVNAQGKVDASDCPEDVAIPEIVPELGHLAWLEGVLNVDVICPPAGTK